MEFWKTSRLKFMNIGILVYLLSITFFAAFTIRFLPEPRSPLTNRADPHHFQMAKGIRRTQVHPPVIMNKVGGGGGRRRKLLRGLGSWPPRCLSKCGKCTPCRPVHIAVPPGSGTPVTAEYYPEAWRCECGNRLYMP